MDTKYTVLAFAAVAAFMAAARTGKGEVAAIQDVKAPVAPTSHHLKCTLPGGKILEVESPYTDASVELMSNRKFVYDMQDKKHPVPRGTTCVSKVK